ncbi:hypothetical protein R1sor_010021 [Riccia sorocarpa]|uniref:Endonuclease/exonuclease/phosphatase domain-containing protein n=1 Tax=Riccia sorocarpa TaxID=122646 RepID=A0ABD3I0S5_9MARC
MLRGDTWFLPLGLSLEQEKWFEGERIWWDCGVDQRKMGLDIQIEFKDQLNQFVCLRVGTRELQSFLFFTYFAPEGARVYGQVGADPYLELSRLVLKVRERGAVWLWGDFNSRTGVEQSQAGGGCETHWRTVEGFEEERRVWSRRDIYLYIGEWEQCGGLLPNVINGRRTRYRVQNLTFSSGLGPQSFERGYFRVFT